ncbi:AAA family ATPase [Actinoplanes sp. NBRC 103695]|uniref:AAA family ATPase n=1 Tax=Actinoplanes sp. NBRC 103695 TaxID=3032202 RepID=UPI0024A36B6F|nr:AAA family ATPase [Actinoplanes sp. NBRC 103695]GLY95121.1 hypothetical protein Acsp02_23760 [Actinoplanes sp. NBRC 103695]
MAEALLLSGTVGAGKTSVADALGDLLQEAGVAGAVIDVDWLRRCWPAPPGDRFHHDLTLRNLQAVAGTYLAAGAHRLVLAGVLESRDQRDDYQAALGVPLTVCRLHADLTTVRQRLEQRHAQDPAGLAWHRERCGELDDILRRANVEDFTVDGSTGSVHDIAAAVRAAAGWKD